MKYPVLFLVIFIAFACKDKKEKTDTEIADSMPIIEADTSIFVSYEFESGSEMVFCLLDSSGNFINNFQKLKEIHAAENKELIFATNGGMFQKDFNPVGLYIEDHDLKKKIEPRTKARGNFYMQPNGVFYTTDNFSFHVVKTQDFKLDSNINNATQSGPLLIHKGEINNNFGVNSTSYYIRNGVGILPNGNALFVISSKPINFHSFAKFFYNKGCKEALYLDGFVSRFYLPEKGFEQDGKFGVIIAKVESNTSDN